MSTLQTLRIPRGSNVSKSLGQQARPVARRVPRLVIAAASAKSSTSTDAVVIGGGIAGLLTAHVLAQRFDRVVLVEKDCVESGRVENETFKETAVRRRGVPQMTQPHQLVVGAVKALDALMPGFRAETLKKGGVDLDLGLHVRYFDYGAVFPRQLSGLKGLGVSRRFLEECIRDRVFQEGKEDDVLQVNQGARVTDFLWNGDAVEGVVLDDGTEIKSHLVVDATGRASKTSEWLKRRELEAPEMISVDPHVASASRMVKMPEDWNEEWKLLVCKTQPYGKSGGTLLPIEGNMWQVTLAEVNGADVPRDEEGFLEFARSLPDQTMYETLRRCTPVTPINKYMAMKNELLRYDAINIPRGLLLVGDSVQRLNAVYGQGIGVASQSVMLLQTALDEALKGCTSAAESREAVTTLGSTFQPRLAEALKPAWTLATKADLKYNTTTASGAVTGPSGVDNFITDSLLTAAQGNPRVYHKLLAVAHLTAPASSLFTDPGVLGATAKSAIGLWTGGRGAEKSKAQVV